MMRILFFIGAITFASSCTVNAQVVTLDYYFNHEVHHNTSGKAERFHYMWEDKANTGFSILGDAFKTHGAELRSLEEPPSASTLKNTNVYIIVDPDTKKENPNPHY